MHCGSLVIKKFWILLKFCNNFVNSPKFDSLNYMFHFPKRLIFLFPKQLFYFPKKIFLGFELGDFQEFGGKRKILKISWFLQSKICCRICLDGRFVWIYNSKKIRWTAEFWLKTFYFFPLLKFLKKTQNSFHLVKLFSSSIFHHLQTVAKLFNLNFFYLLIFKLLPFTKQIFRFNSSLLFYNPSQLVYFSCPPKKRAMMNRKKHETFQINFYYISSDIRSTW